MLSYATPSLTSSSSMNHHSSLCCTSFYFKLLRLAIHSNCAICLTKIRKSIDFSLMLGRRQRRTKGTAVLFFNIQLSPSHGLPHSHDLLHNCNCLQKLLLFMPMSKKIFTPNFRNVLLNYRSVTHREK